MGITVQHHTHAKKMRAKNYFHFSNKAFHYLQPSLLCSCVFAWLEHAHSIILVGKISLAAPARCRHSTRPASHAPGRSTRYQTSRRCLAVPTGCDSTAMNCCEAPCTFTGSSQGADMYTTHCIGLDIGLKRRCTEENQSMCCVVHGRQSCPDAFYFSPCRILLEWSQLPTTHVLRTVVHYMEGFVGARSPDSCASQTLHTSSRRSVTCDL